MTSFQSIGMSDSKSTPTYTVPIPKSKSGSRLDKVLAEALENLSRTRIKDLIQKERVFLGGGADQIAVTDPAYRVIGEQVFFIDLPKTAPAILRPQAIGLTVVYEDDDIIIIDKPAGLVVHPAAGNPDGTLVNALLAHCEGSLSGIGGVARPGIVHRLDKDTSGLLVAAKNDQAHKGLAEQFSEHTAERAYQAAVWGVPSPREGKIEGNIGRSPRNRKKMAIVRSGGKPARTRYRVLRTFGAFASLIECRLDTGRTHQIRVHMASIGHTVIGDPLYGSGSRRRGLPETARQAAKDLGRQALHAYVIGILHPRTLERIKLTSVLPDDITSLISKLDAV